ncbi:hypothetical protein JIN84_04660 [Luteolibacter yonseiensis]|uniref:Uncharacterized protein n=1 Tax=Luteolibacter yonseiensis TaxID=1144680 RepID=A0A934R488_9BACT|nr:hypothetical protein [Luteolibacter yonseiensis]MBK1814894.1 hypothetical protein [Luteolibacter yonseiensis]
MSTLRSIIPLAAGLAIGATGAILFIQSMPPPEGSAEERVAKLEAELKQSNNRVASLEALDPQGSKRPGRTLKDGLRSIADDFREGRPVTPEDVFRATQPLIRDLAPIFDRMRTKELQRRSDELSGELARKYSLTPDQQESLKKWLDVRAEEEAKRFTALISQKGVKMEDLNAATNDIRIEDGLESFMRNTLSPDKYVGFKAEHMREKVESVQKEADMKVERLDQIVKLDDDQRGQVFGMLARGARDYDPEMRFEGQGTDSTLSGKSKQDAILSVLRPDQRASYEEARAKQRAETEKELGSIGLSLPEDFDSRDFLEF